MEPPSHAPSGKSSRRAQQQSRRSITPQDSFLQGTFEPSPSASTIWPTDACSRARKPLPPYSAVGQFSYAPATQTTVVTTTTTTTTHFPIFRLRPPRNLDELDPKQYPLAALATPPNLKRFCFDIDGKPTYFREAEDPNQAVQDYDTLLDKLLAGNGTVRKVEQGEQYVLQENYHKTPVSSTLPLSLTASDCANRKRPASPVSISEAAERVASLQKGNKRRQTTRSRLGNGNGSCTTTTPSSRKSLRSRGTPTAPTALSEGGSPNAQLKPGRPLHQQISQLQHTRTLVTPTRHSLQHQQETPLTLSPQLAPRDFEARPVDSMGLIASNGRDLEADQHHLDAPIDSVQTPSTATLSDDAASARASREGSSGPASGQPLSLPSPSLSPVTAALTHGNSGYFSCLDAEEEITSPFELAAADDQSTANSLQILQSAGREVDRNQRQSSGLMGIPHMIDSFDSMPPQVQSYVMYQLLRRCSKNTLQMVAGVVNPALKCDFLSLLPLELSLNITKYLDVKSLCNAAQVCKRWRVIIDSDDWTWKKRFDDDGYILAEGELERAVKEGWAYHDPKGNDDYERDIRAAVQYSKVTSITPTTQRVQKRKTRAMVKQQKKKQEAVDTLGKEEFNELMSELSNNDYPFNIDTSGGTFPTHAMGLASLRIPHLYKSIYRRHHLIRQSWIRPDVKPRHISFKGHQRHVVTCLQFDTDKILTGSDDNNINVYDTNTGALRNRLEGHEGGVWALQYEGNTLVSGSTDRTVRVWDITKGECTQVFHGHTSTVRCLQIVLPVKVGVGLDGRDKVMPKQPLIITGSRDSSLRIWKLPRPDDKPYLPETNSTDASQNPYFVRILQGHHSSVRAISAYGDTLVSGSYDYTVRVWRISTGETVHRLNGHTQKVYSVVLDHKRNRCISGSMDNLVKVWSLDTGSVLYTLEGHNSLVGLLDLSHDHLVSAAADSTLRIWDPETGQCKHILTAHTGAITCFQHDEHKVISGSDGTLKMWNVQTGQFIRDLLTDLSGVWQVRFNERRCVAAVQRDSVTYIEVLDFGAARDGVPEEKRGRRIVVNSKGVEVQEGMDNLDEDDFDA